MVKRIRKILKGEKSVNSFLEDTLLDDCFFNSGRQRR